MAHRRNAAGDGGRVSGDVPRARRHIADALRAERQLDVALVGYAESGTAEQLADAMFAANLVVGALQDEARRLAEAGAILARSA